MTTEQICLRDWLAGQALAGGLQQGARDNLDHDFWYSPAQVAKRAYEIADAMIAEHERAKAAAARERHERAVAVNAAAAAAARNRNWSEPGA